MEINNEIEVQEEIVFSERIRKVRKAVDKVIQDKKFNKDRRFIYAHLYGVAQSAAILAKKRGLNAEIAIVAGMLHDIYTLVYLDSRKHAHKGSKMAMRILVDVDMFTPVEIAIIYTAIYNHSDKGTVNGVYDELLKDADVLQHVMYDPLIDVFPKEVKRYNRLIDELGLKEEHLPEPREFGYGYSLEDLSHTIDEAYEELKGEESLEGLEKDIAACVAGGSAAVNVNDSAAKTETRAAEEVVGGEETAKTQAVESTVKADGASAVVTGVLTAAVIENDRGASETETDDFEVVPDVILMGGPVSNVPSGIENEINTELTDEEAEDMLEAVTATVAVATASSAIPEMTTTEAAKVYSRNPKQFEAVIEEINQYIEKINKLNSSIDEQNRKKAETKQSDGEGEPIVPLDYPVPEDYWTDTFYFCKLTPELTELDYEAVMEARDEIRRIYNITDHEEWPNDSLTLEEDREDLVAHEKEFDDRQAFAYSVFNLARKKCFGCFYISPCSKPDHDVFITLWGLNEAITSKLYKDVKNFVNEKFEFKNPAFPVFEIPLKEWEESVNPGAW